MSSQKTDGTNIDNWTLEELVEQVQIFKDMQKMKKTNLVESRIVFAKPQPGSLKKNIESQIEEINYSEENQMKNSVEPN